MRRVRFICAKGYFFGITDLNLEKLDERRVRFKFSGCYYFGENVITVKNDSIGGLLLLLKILYSSDFFPEGD